LATSPLARAARMPSTVCRRHCSLQLASTYMPHTRVTFFCTTLYPARCVCVGGGAVDGDTTRFRRSV
jgi:hypothetical protein